MHYTKTNGGALDGAVSVISINGSLEYQVGRDASSSEAGIAKLYDTVPTTGGATDGAVTQQAVVNAITDVKTNIEDNELVVASALNDLDSRINNMPIIPFVKKAGGVAGSASTNRTLWTGTVDSITELYNGLPILIKVPVAGVAAGITLDINNLGEHPVIINANTLLTLQYAVGCIIMLVYDSSKTITLNVNNTNTSFTGCWKTSDYNTNTTYGGGTLAQLRAGTSDTNRLWPAAVLHNYINSTVIDGSRISGTIDTTSTNSVRISASVISGGTIGSNNETTVDAKCISGNLGSSNSVDFGSSCNFSGLRAGVIPGRAISGDVGNGSLLVSLGSAVNFTGVKSDAIPADKIAYGYPTSKLSGSIPGTIISGSLYSDVNLYTASLGIDLATGNSLQYIDYPYDRDSSVTATLSNMLKDINALKAKGLYKILIDGDEANIQSATATNLENVVSIEKMEYYNVWQITATGPFTVDLLAYLPSLVYNMEFHFMDTDTHYQDKVYTQDTCSTDIIVDGLQGYVTLDFKTLYKDLWIRII